MEAIAIDLTDVDLNTEDPHNHNAGNSSQASIPASGDPPCYNDVYRTGNFGITLGKLNISLGKKWIIALAIRTTLLFILTLAGSILLLDHYTVELFRDLTIAFSYTSAMLGVCVAASGAHFFWHLPTMSHPYAWLMVMRFLAVMSFCINCCFGWLFACFVAGSNNPAAFVGLSKSEIGFLKAVYILVILLQIVESILCWGFFLPPHYSDICDCCHTWCIYSKGEEIAPGVPDPPSQVKMMRFARVAYGINHALN